MKILLPFFLSLFSLLTTNQAQSAGPPTLEQASQFTNSLEATFKATRSWDTKAPKEKLRVLEAGHESIDEPKAIFGDDPFGPFGNCLWAPLALQAYTLKLIQMFDKQNSTRRFKSSEIDELTGLAYNFGEFLEACKRQTKALQPR